MSGDASNDVSVHFRVGRDQNWFVDTFDDTRTFSRHLQIRAPHLQRRSKREQEQETDLVFGRQNEIHREMVNQHDPPLDQFDLCTPIPCLCSNCCQSDENTSVRTEISPGGLPLLQTANIRTNSTQAIRIRALETDIRRLLDENLSLRTELIQTKCSLARQSTSSNLIESTRSAQQALEKVLLDVTGIKISLEDSLQSGNSPRFCPAIICSAFESEHRYEQCEFTRDQEDCQGTSTDGPEIRRIQRRKENQTKGSDLRVLPPSLIQDCSDNSLEAPFVGSPRVMSETDASDSEQEDVITDDIKVSDSSRNPPPPSHPRRDSLAPSKRTGLSLPPTRHLQIASPTDPESTTPPPPVVKENPRKRRRSELFTSGKENLLPHSTSSVTSTLFSPDKTTTAMTAAATTMRGVLAESSPPRPSLVIPAGLTRLESPNKPMNVPVVPMHDKFLKEFEFGVELGLDEEGGGRRTSRARKQVNYALPNLRDKMRREDRTEDVGKGRGRSLSMDRSVTPDFGVSHHDSEKWLLMDKNKQELSTVTAFEMKSSSVKSERQLSPVQQTSPQSSKQPLSQPPSQPDQKHTKPRLSLVERQSLLNSSSRPSSTTDPNPSKKRRTSSLHKPLAASQSTPSLDIFRFPSESPPKQTQPPAKPSHPPARTTKPPPSTTTHEDKENVGPHPSSWPVVIGGRERRKTFNVTMEKLAQLTREEKQADRDWEAEIAAKRRRQSVAM